MGKNKRWKRKAKRIKGRCTSSYACYGCEYHDNGYCDCICANITGCIPLASIRTIERICKYGR